MSFPDHISIFRMRGFPLAGIIKLRPRVPFTMLQSQCSVTLTLVHSCLAFVVRLDLHHFSPFSRASHPRLPYLTHAGYAFTPFSEG